jgi:hypothetical protein
LLPYFHTKHTHSQFQLGFSLSRSLVKPVHCTCTQFFTCSLSLSAFIIALKIIGEWSNFDGIRNECKSHKFNMFYIKSKAYGRNFSQRLVSAVMKITFVLWRTLLLRRGLSQFSHSSGASEKKVAKRRKKSNKFAFVRAFKLVLPFSL